MTKIKLIKSLVLTALFLMLSMETVYSQIEYRWLSVGSFHNFYSNIGSEIEEGLVKEQQYGWQWPAIYRGQDAQAAKALWLGVKNYKDDRGADYPYRVVHVGPRVTGLGEFFPISAKTISKFYPPEVRVDGAESYGKSVTNDEVDPNLAADREIRTVMNTLIGVTVERTIKQFSQQYHDNYHVIEYTFTNTGNIDEDEEIELPTQTLQDFVVYFQNRMAPVAASRYTIDNKTGWGYNTMNDRRGDGLNPSEQEQFRAEFAWHGYLPSFASANYDNIGGPIWVPNTQDGILSASDTTGRLAAYHFVGTVTLHADTSPNNPADDPNQPFTMSELHSDHPRTSKNSAYDLANMAEEYSLMTEGRTSPRHAFKVEPSGYPGFVEPTSDPSLGGSGGYSYVSGYGPYTLAPGESIKIVVAEASAGISRELALETGKLFKAGEIDRKTKNEVVFQGRDSLFQTFERAIANYNSDYSIPSPPEPPSLFEVSSAGDGIELNWEYTGDFTKLEGFEIYRAELTSDSTYRLVAKVPPTDTFLNDGDVEREDNPDKFFLNAPIRGRDYYYYIVSVGTVNNDPTGLTPTGTKLISNRYYSNSFDPANLLRQAGDFMKDIRVVPNPFNSNLPGDLLLSGDPTFPDRIAFYSIPGKCDIYIYTELGELIKTIIHSNGSGDEYWDLKTEYKQRVVSGIYIARIVNKDPNDEEFGATAIRKLVIIL